MVEGRRWERAAAAAAAAATAAAHPSTPTATTFGSGFQGVLQGAGQPQACRAFNGRVAPLRRSVPGQVQVREDAVDVDARPLPGRRGPPHPDDGDAGQGAAVQGRGREVPAGRGRQGLEVE